MPTTHDNLRALAAEIKRARELKGIKTLVELQERTGISQQFLSRIENAHVDRSRGFVIPSDDKLERLSDVLEIPLSRLHALLGRLPDLPFRMYKNPESAEIADEFDQLPDYAQEIVRDAVITAKKVVKTLESSGDRDG